MTRARVFALLAFIAIGAAGGSLILGDAAWFAWSAGVGAIVLIIWGRTHDRPAPAAPQSPRPPEFGRGIEEFDILVFDEDLGTASVRHGADCDRTGEHAQHVHLPTEHRRASWPAPTNHFGAPE